MKKRFSTYRIIQAINGSEMREGDNAVLVKNGKVFSFNDNGDLLETVVEVDLEDMEAVDDEEEQTDDEDEQEDDPDDSEDPVEPDPTPQPVPGATLVHDASELQGAIANGVKHIVGAPGDYGFLSIDGYQDGQIESVDPQNPMRFSGSLVLNTKNLTLRELDFKYTYKSGDSDSTDNNKFENAENPTIVSCRFFGDISPSTGKGHGTGIHFRRGVSGLWFDDNYMDKFWKAVRVGDDANRDFAFVNGEITDMRSDGLSIGKVAGTVTLDGMLIHNFGAAGGGDHADLVQIQQDLEKMIVRNCIFDMGAGAPAQGLFAKALDIPNGTVENNVFFLGQTNGVVMLGLQNGTFRNNSVFRVPIAGREGDKVTWPSVFMNGNVSVQNNVFYEKRITVNGQGGLPAGNIGLTLSEYGSEFEFIERAGPGFSGKRNIWKAKPGGRAAGFGSSLVA